MSNLINKKVFPVTSADTDMFGRLRISSLVNMFIQSAITSADQLGFGYKDLQKANLFWVLSRLTVEISNSLHWTDEAETETWPKNIDRFLYIRDFIVRNASKTAVAKATSGWMAVNTMSKRPAKIEGLHTGIFEEMKNIHALDYSPEKLPEISGGETFDITTTYFDIDLNGHVTATRYIDWIMDTFTFDFLENHYPKKLSINYMKETLPGEKIILNRKINQDGSYAFEGLNVHSNTTAFRGFLKF